MNTNYRPSSDFDADTVASEQDYLQEFSHPIFQQRTTLSPQEQRNRQLRIRDARIQLKKLSRQLMRLRHLFSLRQLPTTERRQAQQFHSSSRFRQDRSRIIQQTREQAFIFHLEHQQVEQRRGANMRLRDVELCFKIRLDYVELKSNYSKQMITELKIMRKNGEKKINDLLRSENDWKVMKYKERNVFTFLEKEDIEVQLFFSKIVIEKHKIIHESVKGSCILSAQDMRQLASQVLQKKEIMKGNVTVGMLYLHVEKENVNQ